MKANQIKIIEKQVAKFRSDYGLVSADAIYLKSFLIRLNVLTIFRPLSEKFSGMSLKDSSSHCFMLINSNHPKGRQHFTIAHELYHLFVELNPKPHKCITGDGKKDQSEQNADMFASIFLMPEEGIYKMLSDEEISKHEVKLSSIIRLEHYFSVSRAALLNRLCDLSLIDKSTKDTLSKFYVIKTAEEYGYDTALYKPGNENLCIGDFGEKAHTLFEMEKISEGHYIELLNKLSYK